MTPEELEKQRQQEQQRRDSFNKKLELGRTVIGAVTVAGISQLKGLDKINQTINDKVANLQSKATEVLSQLASDLGIEGLEIRTTNTT